MTINDEIKDEKIKYDINREEAKTSSLSYRKIDKYEYLTGEEILPFDRSRIMEQAKFTYSRLVKAFEKQIKTTEDQGEKQIKAIEDHGKQLAKYSDEKKESSRHLKQKQIFEEVTNKRMEEIRDLRKQINFDSLTYNYNGKTAPKNFIGFKGSLGFYKNIKEGYTTLEKAEIKHLILTDYYVILQIK